jgi:hypothetical protein
MTFDVVLPYSLTSLDLTAKEHDTSMFKIPFHILQLTLTVTQKIPSFAEALSLQCICFRECDVDSWPNLSHVNCLEKIEFCSPCITNLNLHQLGKLKFVTTAYFRMWPSSALLRSWTSLRVLEFDEDDPGDLFLNTVIVYFELPNVREIHICNSRGHTLYVRRKDPCSANFVRCETLSR